MLDSSSFSKEPIRKYLFRVCGRSNTEYRIIHTHCNHTTVAPSFFAAVGENQIILTDPNYSFFTRETTHSFYQHCVVLRVRWAYGHVHTAILDAMPLILSEASTGCQRGAFDMILIHCRCAGPRWSSEFPDTIRFKWVVIWPDMCVFVRKKPSVWRAGWADEMEGSFPSGWGWPRLCSLPREENVNSDLTTRDD